MQQTNEVKITGFIKKIYPLVTTPNGVKITRLILEHNSTQEEHYKKRKVYCKVFCLLVGSELSLDFIDAHVEAYGFLSANAQQQLVLHISKIKKLN
jgi:primosomal replication protein N